MDSTRYSGIPSYRSIHSSSSTPDLMSDDNVSPSHNFVSTNLQSRTAQRTTTTSTASVVGGTATSYIESPLANLSSHRAPLRETTGLEKLLRDAQQQVRELLPHREENVRLSTELSIQKSILTEKEDEVKKLQRLVVDEREQRQHLARKAADEQSSALQRGESKARMSDEKAHELERSLRDVQGELDRKNRAIRHLEEELAQARTLKQDDRTKLTQKETLLNTVEAERNRAVSQLEEASRANHKLEQVRKELETQLSSLRQEGDRQRRDLEAARKEKADAAAEGLQAHTKMEAMARRVESLQEENAHMMQLRATVVQMEPMKEELALLRRSMESGEQGIHSERMSRKNVEAERDQLLLRVRGLETDIRRLESDCHRAQAEASERIPLRRENEDLRRAIEEANAHLSNVQSELTQERSQRMQLQSKWERTFTSVARGVQALRGSLETRNVPGVDLSSAPPAASPIVGGASSFAQSHFSRDDALNESTDKYPTSADEMIDMRLISALDPLRFAIATVLDDLQKEQLRRQELVAQLHEEQHRNSKLEHTTAALEKSVTQSQLELSAGASRETQAVRQVRHLEDELHRWRMTSRDRTAQLHRLLAAADDGHAAITDITTTTDDAAFQHLVETVRLAASQRDRERRQRMSLELEIKQAHEHAEASRAAQQELLRETELKCQKEIRELQLVSDRHMEETSSIHSDLRAAIQLSVTRYEGVMNELQELKSKHHDTLVQLGDREQAVLDARHESDLLKREASLSATMLQKEKIALQEATVAHSHLHDELTSMQRQLRDTEQRGAECDANASSLLKTTVLLGRVVLGQRTSIETLTLERFWAVQHAKSLEQSLKAILNACPADASIHSVPLSSSRRDASCQKLLRYTTLRPVVLAVIAALRLQRMYFALRGAPHATRVQSSIVLGAPPMRLAKSKGRTILLPQVGELSINALCSALGSPSTLTMLSHRGHIDDVQDSVATSPSRLRQATRMHPWDINTAVQSILDVLQASATPPLGVCWKRSFSFMWDMAAGLTRRNALLVGTTGQTQLASAAVKQFLRATHDGMALIERSLDTAKRENNSLVEMVQAKEQRIQSLMEEIAAGHDERRRMVPRREFEAAEVALRETRHALAEEQVHHHTATERIAALKNNEANLLLRQSELQNESRSLAIELTRKSAMLASSPTRRPAVSPPGDLPPARHAETRRDHSPSPTIARASTLTPTALNGHIPKVYASASDGHLHHHRQHNMQSAVSSSTTTRVTSQTFARSTDSDIMGLIRGIDEKLSTALQR